MARITVEDCLQEENNRFALVQLASKRTKQILSGSKTLLKDTRGNKPVVVSLREIAEGKVKFMSDEEARIARELEEQQARQESPKKEMPELPKLTSPSAKPLFDDSDNETSLESVVVPDAGDDEPEVKSSRNGEVV